MQLDIETYISPGFEFPTAAREGDRIVAIALSDTDGFELVLRGDRMDERAMLEELVRIVRERDPDIIEGHNLFRFDLEYLEERARRHRVKLALGRDGSGLRGRPSRLQIAERSLAFRRYDIYGRGIIDTWILAQHYDIASRELESFGLKDLAIHFGLAREGRVYLDASRVSEHFEQRPEELFAYALDDVRETRGLAEVLSPSYFVQAQIFPYSFQNAVLRGNATKINALLMRAYIAARHSIPSPMAATEVLGGYTEVRRCGVARNVLHCDVTSLYPSLMIEGNLRPASDRLGVFLKLLKDLRSFRVQAKAAARELAGAERRDLDALQQTFKILINSFYGYLGFSLGHFNDFAIANVVTHSGRELIQRAVIELEARGAADTALSELLPGTVQFLSDLCHVQAAEAAGEVSRICAELVFGYKRHPSWNDAGCSECFSADEIEEFEETMPGITAMVMDVLKADGSHPEKAGPCASCARESDFLNLQSKLSRCLSGARLAKDRAAETVSTVMIPEALDYPQ
jgi:DNA polymerase elongation subunit (family B)